jgi:hypothetical protein
MQVQEKVYDRQSIDLPINAQVAPDTVADPLERGAMLRVTRSIRDDPLARLYIRSKIDTAQLAAGRHWQRLYEAAEIGAASAIDPGKEAVDGGKFPEPITDEQIHAFRSLNAVYRVLGEDGGALIRAVLGRGLMVTQVAQAWGVTTKRETEYLGTRFRECLERMAIHWGYAPPKRLRY